MISLVWALAIAVAPAPVAADPGAVDQLERVYQQSCAERAYGSYNDMCDQMRRDIRAYQRSQAAERRVSPARTAPAGSSATGAETASDPRAPGTSQPKSPR